MRHLPLASKRHVSYFAAFPKAAITSRSEDKKKFDTTCGYLNLVLPGAWLALDDVDTYDSKRGLAEMLVCFKEKFSTEKGMREREKGDGHLVILVYSLHNVQQSLSTYIRFTYLSHILHVKWFKLRAPCIVAVLVHRKFLLLHERKGR